MTSEEIQAIFFTECEEALAAVESGLTFCASGAQDAETINGIFRAVHSIKGGAGAFGFAALQSFSHCLEALLSDVRDETLPVTGPLVELLLRSLDMLSDHIDAAREGSTAPDDVAMLVELTGAQAGSGGAEIPLAETLPAEAGTPPDDDGFDLDLDALLDDISGDLAPVAQAKPQGWQIMIRPHAGAMRNGGEPLLLLRELAEAGAHCTGCDLSELPALEALDPSQGYLGWTFAVPPEIAEAAVRDIFDFVGEDCGIAVGSDAVMPPVRIDLPAPTALPAVAPANANDRVSARMVDAPVASPVPGQSIRIELVKLDKLIDTVGELIIAQAMLAQRLGNKGIGANEEINVLEGLTRSIQEGAMAIRAQPIGAVFSRVPRILRELTASTGKQVRLEVSGETTELDKAVIERLGEPLTHLIRNAIDHGIESSEERLAAGKSAEGTLLLSAEQRSGRIVICLTDDGRGIDRARVFAKAVEKGLVAPDAQLSSEEINRLIFAPGFSTAQTVSNISGRGVGMDVVRQNVKELGGRITVESQEGAGTSFTLSLPLTLAISDGMIVNIGDQTMVVPLANVVESLRPGPEDIQSLGSGSQMLSTRGKFIPIIPVCQIIGASSCLASAEHGVLIVVDTEAAGQAALLVDAICDQRQFVIKSLETHYGAVEGVTGATILGDGRIALILDVDGLVAGALAPGQLEEAA